MYYSFRAFWAQKDLNKCLKEIESVPPLMRDHFLTYYMYALGEDREPDGHERGDEQEQDRHLCRQRGHTKP